MVAPKSAREQIAHYRARIRQFSPPRSTREVRLIAMLEFLIEETEARSAESDNYSAPDGSRSAGSGR
jgi:hypothetical protein